MKHLTVIACLLTSNLQAAASARTPDHMPTGGFDCALEAQRSVARRHRLSNFAPGGLSQRVYADPELAREADDAFDACVRRRSRTR